jgi:hypothetical protein
MFLYGLWTGLELGLLDEETYLEPARKAWLALIEYLSDDGRLNNIAEGFWPSSGTADEYINARKGSPGNSHGTAGFLWAATGVVRYFHYKDSLSTHTRIPSRQPHLSMKTHTPRHQGAFFDLRGRKIPSAHTCFNNRTPQKGVMIHVSNLSIRKTVAAE